VTQLPKAPPTRKRVARATIHDVATRAGVSKSLVSLALSGSPGVSEQSRAAVEQAARELNYRANAMARGLVGVRTRRLGVLLSDLRNPFFGDLSSGLLERSRELGYELVFTTGDREWRFESLAIDAMLELRADGLILAAPQVDDATIDRAARETAVVVLNRRVESSLCDYVTDDDYAGGRLAAEHLADLGHTRLAHIDGGPGAGAATRRAGFEAAVRDLGLEQTTRVVSGSFTEEGGFRGAQKLLSTGASPTAIFAANDLAAIGAVAAVEAAGLAVPGDISIIGYDNSYLSRLRHLSLTSIDQSASDLGRLAIDRIIERIENGRTESIRDVLPPTLVARGSTAAPPKES
jgi:DNA-binding LacI/PurR family transcriptional regulator